jgi:two-component system LytT family sensor kinase
MRRWILPTIVVTVWWTLDGFTDVMNYRLMQPADDATLRRVWRAYMWSVWLWIPISLGALWLSDRFPLGLQSWSRALTIHMAGAVGACLVRALAVIALNPWVQWYLTLPSLGDVVVTSFANNFFLYWMIVAGGHALVYARRVRERDQQLARAELHALKMQLHPHFLFNTLNTINTYVRADQDVAQRMIARLSDLLRRVLEREAVQEVTLQEELRLVGAYLDIEQVRFEDRLTVEWDINGDAMRAVVPHLILQPLVENAIRHGIAPRAVQGTLRIAARRDNGDLRLTVRDNGQGVAAAASDANGGRGLSITRNRLKHLYGDGQSLRITSPAEGGFEVQLTVPYKLRPVDA